MPADLPSALPLWVWGAGGALLGAVIGSFLATVAIRWPRGESVVAGRSACDACGRALGPVDLLPVAGFLIRRGRCAACAAPIDRRHVAIELACLGVGAVSLTVAPGVAGLAGALFGWLLIVLAVLDAEHFWLPDPLVAAVALTGLAGVVLGLPPDAGARLIGGLAGFGGLALVALAYRMLRGRRGMGGGDPKLLGAIGLNLGWQTLPFVLLGASLAGLALVALGWLRGQPIRADRPLAFGALMAIVAWPIWLVLLTA